MKTCKQNILLVFSFCLLTCHRQISQFDYADINVEKAGTLGNLNRKDFRTLASIINSDKYIVHE